MVLKKILRDVPIFSELSDKELGPIIAAGSKREIPKGEVVFSEGDPGDFLFVITRGKVKVVLRSKLQKELILSRLGPGSCLGELAVLDDEPRSATVVALEYTEFLEFSKEQLFNLIQWYPPIHRGILRHLARKLRETTETAKTLALFEAYDRILRVLISLARKQRNFDRTRTIIQDKPRNQDLARMVNCRRETVGRAIKILQENGYVTVTKKGLALEARALGSLHPR